MSTIAILSPGYPEHAGGVRDHTHRLARGWEAAGHTVLVAGTLSPGAATRIDDWARQDVRAALIQYVPFLYGARGLSTYPEQLATRARSRGIRTTVFVHEPWVPPTRLPWLVLSALQRRQLRRLMARCAAAVSPVPAWQALLGTRTDVVYVGSTLGNPPENFVPAAPLPAPVVFSITAAGMNVEWIAAAVDAISASPGAVVLGSAANAASRHPLVAPWFEPSWDWRGHLPAAEVLRALCAARLVLAPYSDGATGRRSALLAALSTGARVLTTRGHLYDPLFDTGPLAVANTREEFAAAARQLWHTPDDAETRARRMAWYHQHFDAGMLDARLLRIVLGEAGA